MIVPTFWAEGRVQERVNGKQVTIRRFGWSDTSQADAQAGADIRAREAMLRFIAGDKIERREPKLAYNGAAGVPIREEIVSKHGDTVITRNLYGARCLNTPDVLFADIDFETRSSGGLGCLFFIIVLVAAVITARQFGSGSLGLFIGLPLAGVAFWIASMWPRWMVRLRGGPEKVARARLQSFLNSHPDWHLRLYRTPAGFRVLAMHRTFKPDEPDTRALFAALGTDPIYARMCANQQCFRARVSPKPWRIGISAHLKPRPGVWPINPDRLPERNRWVEAYERAGQSHSACQFVQEFGAATVNPKALAVQKLHDELARAGSGLPMA